jgi:outer membrane protein
MTTITLFTLEKYSTYTKSRKSFFYTALIATALLSLSGQTVNAAKTYSLSQYIDTAFEQSQTIKQYEESLRQNQYSYALTFIDAFLPSLSLSMSTPIYDKASRFRFNKNEMTTTLSAGWNLFNSGDDVTKLKLSSISRTKAEINLDQIKQKEALKALGNFFSLLTAQRLLEVAKQDLENKEKEYNITKNLYDQGIKSWSDSLQSQSSLKLSELQFAQKEASYKRSLINFNNLINEYPLEEVELTEEDFSVNNLQTTLDEDIEKALNDRFDIRLENLSLRSSRISYNKKIRDQFPHVSVDASWSKSGFPNLNLPGDGNITYGITASLYFDIGFFGAQKPLNVLSAKSSLRSEILALEQLKKNIRNDVITSRIDLELQMRSLELSEFNIKISKEALEIIQKKYRQGNSSFTELTQAQKDYLDTQNNYTQAKYNLYLNLMEYKNSLGEIIWK